MAESGSVAGLVTKWRQIALDSQEEQYNDGDYGECAKQLEAALAKDELRVAAVELAKARMDKCNCDCSECDAARRVLRLAGEA